MQTNDTIDPDIHLLLESLSGRVPAHSLAKAHADLKERRASNERALNEAMRVMVLAGADCDQIANLVSAACACGMMAMFVDVFAAAAMGSVQPDRPMH